MIQTGNPKGNEDRGNRGLSAVGIGGGTQPLSYSSVAHFLPSD
jgi:hypothetical protein